MDPDTQTPQPAPASAPPAAAHAAKVLIVEDDEFLRDLVVQRLLASGVDVSVARDGEEGLARAGEHPDLILLDLVLPGFGGFEMIAKLNQHEETAHIPFIVLSNLAEEQNLARSKQLGAAGYLVKAQATPGDVVEEVKKYFAAHPVA